MGAQDIVRRHYTPLRALSLLTFTLYLIYLDRGIVAGSATSIKGCVESLDLCSPEHAARTCGNKSNPHNDAPRGCSTDCRVCGTICSGAPVEQTGFGINNEQLAVAQTSFMAGYLLGCVSSAHFSQHILPFRLVSLGLSIWCISVVISAMAGWMQEGVRENGMTWAYYLLVLGRAFGGFGEAALSTLALPFLNCVLDPDTKGFYIAVYYSGIPAGTALGFIYAGAVSALTGDHWEWAFLIEMPLMLPIAIIAFFVPFTMKRTETGKYIYFTGQEQEQEQEQRQEEEVDQDQDQEEDQERRNGNTMDTNIDMEQPRALGLVENIGRCLRSTEFVYAVLGYAVYTGVIGGLQFYAPTFVQTYRPCDPRWAFSQVQTDVIFGMMICVAGFFGTLLGGVLVDRINVGSTKLWSLALLSVVEMAFACLFALSLLFIVYPPVFFAIFALCLIALFAISPAINILAVESVPARNGPMAIGILTIGIHLFGDVPSPVIIGRISDANTPLFTMTVTLAYLLLTLVFWSRILCIRQPQRSRPEGGEEPLLQDSS